MENPITDGNIRPASAEPALYLIPVTLGDTPLERVLPSYNTEVISGIRHFIVEELRTARRFLKQVDRNINIDSLNFYPMGKHADPALFSKYLSPLRKGEAVGVISEAGCPAVADPGADLVAIAQREGLRVVPLVGPSSILLGLKQLEARAVAERQTQLFIETPYRNAKLFSDICQACSPTTRLCVAAGLTTPQEYIRTRTLKEWKACGLPDLGKIPAIFLIYR